MNILGFLKKCILLQIRKKTFNTINTNVQNLLSEFLKYHQNTAIQLLFPSCSASIWNITGEWDVKEGIEGCKSNKASNSSHRSKYAWKAVFQIKFSNPNLTFGLWNSICCDTHSYFPLAHQGLCFLLWQSNYMPVMLLRRVKSWSLNQLYICNARKKLFPLGYQLKLYCLWLKLRTCTVACITTSTLPIWLLSSDAQKFQSPQIGYMLCEENEVSDDSRIWP